MPADPLKDLDLQSLIPKFPDLQSLAPKLPDLRNLPELRNPVIESLEHNYASAFHERLVKMISRFDAKLDQEHEVGARLVNFGESVVFHLANIGFWNPSLIIFSGETDDGKPVELIQHVSQISVLLVKLPRKDPSKPKQPLGFVSDFPDSPRP
ncbi:MAG: DUF6173 family protein [Bryobacteraceae bacterium]|jgi:hypothetical protein